MPEAMNRFGPTTGQFNPFDGEGQSQKRSIDSLIGDISNPSIMLMTTVIFDESFLCYCCDNCPEQD